MKINKTSETVLLNLTLNPFDLADDDWVPDEEELTSRINADIPYLTQKITEQVNAHDGLEFLRLNWKVDGFSKELFMYVNVFVKVTAPEDFKPDVSDRACYWLGSEAYSITTRLFDPQIGTVKDESHLHYALVSKHIKMYD